jgi:hypothetical protein
MSLYGKQKHYSHGVVFTETGFTGDYRWAPKEYVRRYDPDWFKAYWENMKKKVEEGVEKNGDGFKLKRNFIVWDDSLGLLESSSDFLNFIATHRHTSTDVWILSQALTARGSVAKTVRLNTTYAFMWPTASLDNLKGLYANYGGMFTLEQFRNALDSCRERRYSCLCLKNNELARTSQEQFTTVLAGEVPEFRLKYGKSEKKEGEKGDDNLPEDEQAEARSHDHHEHQRQQPTRSMQPPNMQQQQRRKGMGTRRPGWTINMDDDFDDL